MSDDAQRPGTPENASADQWASPADGPAGEIPGAPVTPAAPAGRPPTAPRDTPAPDPWAPPVDQAPGSSADAAGTGGPHGTVVSGSAPSVHDQPTAVSLPSPAAPGAPVQGPWAAPFAPPSPAPAAPPAPPGSGNPFAPPPPAAGEPVPPPPIGPEGPGQMPYGYPQYPGGYPGYGTPYGPSGAAPGYDWPGMPPMPRNGMGTASLVLGIVSAAVFCLWPLAIVLGVLAVIFCIIGRRRAHRGEATNSGMALAGIICGAVGFVLGVALLIVVIAVPDDNSDGPWTTTDNSYSTSLVTGAPR